MGLEVDMALKFYTSIVKGLKIEVLERVLEANIFVCSSYRRQIGSGGLSVAPILKRIKIFLV